MRRCGTQLCSRRPEQNLLDFAVHISIVLLLTVFYAYFSLGMDDDPVVCYAT